MTTKRPPAELLRFTRGERWVHRATAILMGHLPRDRRDPLHRPCSRSCSEIARSSNGPTSSPASACRSPSFSALLSKAFRSDAGRLNRFTRNDWKWLRSRQRRDGTIPVGKFNAGQKLNANFQIGAILTMLGTGPHHALRKFLAGVAAYRRNIRARLDVIRNSGHRAWPRVHGQP